PYIVMEEIEGENLWDCYQTISKEDKDQLLERFVKVFFELHELDVSIVDKELVKDSTISFIEKEINEIKKLVEENKLEYFTQIIDWLQKEKTNIIGEKLSIIHRDYHPWNVIVDNNEKIYVIDLLWGIGDYRFDLAWMYT
ncbi:phosphotransferase, partial [Clostridium perfringens]|nr:phosphotransferase [Clostridium perfringens]